MHVDIAVRCSCELGEGPVWHDGVLRWVDINRGDVYCWRSGDAAAQSTTVGGFVSAIIPRRRGGCLLARQHEIQEFDESTGPGRVVARVPRADPRVRLNDAKCDPGGRLWFGELHLDGSSDACRLFSLDRSGSPRMMLEGVSLSNGLGWAADGASMFFVDSARGTLDRFRFDDGEISERCLVRAFDDATPDGLAVDLEGGVWVALWDGGRVVRVDGISGELLGEVRVPVSRPTSCCFGGDDLRTLYITSALPEEARRTSEPEAGCVFAARAGVAGVPVEHCAI
ncbi:MAG: SMP-30/gluconolactonase/LRE family protein [Planctomycetota bacterium]